jgi:hypothetical protein
MQYIRCYEDRIFLSEKRSQVTWKAVTLLALKHVPQRQELLRIWKKSHVASPCEASLWREAFERIKEMKTESLVFDPSNYMTPLGTVDFDRISSDFKIPVQQVSLMIKMNDRMLMVRAAGEILFAVTHSSEKSHKIGLYTIFR